MVVTTRQKQILGIDATVVHDVVTEHGDLIENTWDWYAQDGCGNVWYLGENTKDYENGVVVSTAGSWEAGVNGAQPGVVMPADPQVGLSYRQEYYAGEAEDAATILSLTEQAEVPYGHFSDVILTKEYTPLHPEDLEYKLYAEGIGARPGPSACPEARIGKSSSASSRLRRRAVRPSRSRRGTSCTSCPNRMGTARCGEPCR